MKKNDVYQVFDSRFNKDDMYKQISNELKKQKGKQVIMKYSFASILFIFVVSGFFISKNIFDQKEVPSAFDEIKDEIYINEVDNTMYDSVSNLDVHVLDSKYSNFDVVPISVQVPDDLKLDTIHLVYIKNDQTNEYDILHDVIQCYRGNERGVNVSYSSIGEVLRDVDIPNGSVSIISGIEVMISKNDETFISQFKYHDIYYDIESYCLTIDEVINMIKSIIE